MELVSIRVMSKYKSCPLNTWEMLRLNLLNSGFTYLERLASDTGNTFISIAKDDLLGL